MKEHWKEYKVYNGKTIKSHVKISDLGNVEGYVWNYENWSDNFITTINGRKAIKNHHFFIYVLVDKLFRGPLPKGYCVHHINHNKFDDRLENLQRITINDHCGIHNKDKHDNGKWIRTPEFRQRMSEERKGKHITEERKQSISTTMKKKIWFTNGIECIRLFEWDNVPEGFYQGRFIKHRRTKKEINNDKV